MPDRRHHRGAHPEDPDLFATRWVDTLRAAVRDLDWLAGRGYPPRASLELVGNRYGLDRRQRVAVRRAAGPEAVRRARLRRRVAPAGVRGARVAVDGFNVLTTVEAALAGGVVLACRDGCYRDMASMHGTWRTVEETHTAIGAIDDELTALGAACVTWHLDRPVSNSGRLAEHLRAVAAERSRAWEVVVEDHPDTTLRHTDAIVASADSGVLDTCARWLDLAGRVVRTSVPDAWVVDMTPATHG